MMGWYGNGMGSGVGMIMMLVVWGSLVAFGVWAVSRLTRADTRPAPTETPRQILDRRLAAGEIDGEEYAEARRLLESRATLTPPRS